MPVVFLDGIWTSCDDDMELVEIWDLEQDMGLLRFWLVSLRGRFLCVGTLGLLYLTGLKTESEDGRDTFAESIDPFAEKLVVHRVCWF